MPRSRQMGLIERVWRRAKQWSRFPVGPVAVYVRAGRNVRVSQSQLAFDASATRKHADASTPPRAAPDVERSPPPVRGQVAVLIGVGPGFGFALARKLAASGMRVVMVARSAGRLDPLVDELRRAGHAAQAYGCDATHEADVRQLMHQVASTLGVPDLVVYSVQGSGPGEVIDVEVAAFEESWRQNCLGGFIVAREAARRMTPVGRGSIVLVGSTSSLIGRAGHLNLAVGKFGLRALAQVMARELWSRGIHVAHVVIDADIIEPGKPCDDGQPHADPAHIADLVHALHEQRPSAWTSELDVRPWNERFWEHC